MTANNKQALYNVLKGLLVTGGPVTAILTNQLGMDPGLVKMILESAMSLLSIAGLVWLGIGGTDKVMVDQVANLKGVQVRVDPNTAPSAVVALANSPASPDVVPMADQPVDNAPIVVDDPAIRTYRTLSQ